MPTILHLPGWQNSGPTHWLSRWENRYAHQRVQQHDWMHPLRGDWVARLEDVLLAQTQPVILVAHSLGCQLVAAWAAHSRNTHRVSAALLVAPGDTESEQLQSVLKSWSPVVLRALPFTSMLLASHNDPWCSFARAAHFAQAWGAELLDWGHCGHINADSGLGDWPEGHAVLERLQARIHSPSPPPAQPPSPPDI
ncbi:MAG: alpha/beta hydrolase [Rhodoferax sp.]|nr:alpha/beta hydrolase [Rhodoferax sp.]